MMTETEKLNRRRCLEAGSKIAEGPMALFPPPGIDDFGWLECDLRIITYAADFSTCESVSLYTDDTMNREGSFLKPVLRRCTWHRENDIYGKNEWPSVTIELGYIEDIKHVSNVIIHLQSSLSKLNFTPLGVSLKRDVAEVDCNHGKSSFDLFMRNGMQSMTCSSCYINNDEFCTLVIRTHRKLLNAVVPFEKDGWQEQYEYDLKEKNLNKIWKWDYKRK